MHLLCLVPGRNLPKELLGSSRKFQSEVESKHSVNCLKEVEAHSHLLFDLPTRVVFVRICSRAEEISKTYLLRHTEVMGIVLLEPSNPGQSRQSPAELVSVQDTKVGHSNRKFPVTTIPRRKYQTMTGAVHRLESELFLLDVELEHVLGVVLPVP